MGAVLTSPEVLNNKNWAKCNLAADFHLRENLVEILHNQNNAYGSYAGLPENPTDLYNFFDKNRGRIKKRSQNSKKGDMLVFDDQFNLLLPANKQTHISQMDISLIVSIIKNFLKGHPFGVAIDDALALRNKLKHCTLNDLKTEQQANEKLQQTRGYLVTMKYSQLTKFDEMVKDDKFIFETETAKNYLLIVFADLKKYMTDQLDKRIDHEKKVVIDYIIKQLKPRHLKGMSIFSFIVHRYFEDTPMTGMSQLFHNQ